MTVAGALLLIGAIAILLPMAVWSVECFAALLPARKPAHPGTVRPKIAVLVPAHNEAGGIARTLASLTAQVHPGDVLLVIADNCSDDTARIARQAGAQVIERSDPDRRGKSYALDYAVRSIGESAADVFVVMDADCTMGAGALDRMARLAFHTGRPVQAGYGLELPVNYGTLQPLAALAFRVKNVVRPCGLDRLHLPCFLNGCGMALPAKTLTGGVMANGRIAEDKWLTADLALAGHAPLFCREAEVTGTLPGQKTAQRTQATRWVHGHLECIRRQGPRLLAGALRQRSVDLLALLLDLLVPPLSLLVVLWAVVLAGACLAGALGSGWTPAVLLAGGGLGMMLALTAVVLRYRTPGIAAALWAVPVYLLAKLPIYIAFVRRREKNWVRTGRDPVPPR